MSLLITGARLVDPASGHDGPCDVRIEGGLIAETGQGLAAGPEDRVISARGHVLAPALIDLRARSGGPDSLDTVLKAAATGGVGTLLLAPEQGGGVTRAEDVERIAAHNGPIRVYASGLAVTRDGEMGEIGLMLRAGALCAGDGGRPISDARLARRVLAYASGFDAWMALTPEDAELSRDTIAHESDMSVRMGLAARPAVSERIGIERAAALAELTGARILFDRVTTSEGLSALAAARWRGLEIAATAPITHLAFNEIDMGGFDPRFRLDPPLRAPSDREALIAAVAEGLIDAVVSDHAPVAPETKANPFPDAAPGSAHIEALLPALCALAAEGRFSLAEALRPVTSGPADLFGLPQGRIEPGAPADLVIFDPDAPVIHGRAGRISTAPSAFSGRRLHGRVLTTLVGGVIAYESEA